MEMVQNTKDTEQNIEHIAEVLGIDRGCINYDEKEQVYLISALQELEKLEIKKEVNFSQLLNYPLKFIKCYFLQGLSVWKQEFKENLIFDNVVFSKSINFSRNTFYREVEFANCKFEYFSMEKCSFEKEAIFTSCIFRDYTSFYEVNFNSKVNFCSTSFFESVSFFKVNFLSPYTKEDIINILSSKKMKLQAVFIGTFNNDFRYITANKSFSIQEATFSDKVDFSRSTFNGNVNFCFVKFNGRAIFDKSNFFEALIFKKTIFKESNPSFLETNFTKTFQIEQKDLLYKYNDLKKINNYDKLLSYRDLFRKLKSNRIAHHNLIDASELHTQELYARELELKHKKGKTLKERIEKWQLWFYRKLCDHHTDILKSFHSLMLVIGLFGLVSLGVIVGFDYCLGYKPILSHLYMIKEIYDAHIQSFIKTHTLYTFAFNIFILAFYLVILVCLISVKYLREVFIGVSYFIVINILLISPKILIPAMGIFTDKRVLLDPLSTLGGIYTIVFGFVLFSFIKTIRKNSIVPS